MQHRDRLIGFTVFKDGVRKMGIADITLPDVEYMTESLKGSGVGGEVDLVNPGNISVMSSTFNWRTLNDDLVVLSQPKTHQLECLGAIEQYDAGTGEYVTKQAAVTMRVTPKKVSLGKLENNATMDANNEFSVVYLKLKLDGQTVLEIDPLNYIFNVGGTDFLSAVRAALGLA